MNIAKERLQAQARALGFDAVGVASAREAWPAGGRLEEYLSEGRHGDMEWMAQERRAHPTALWAEAKSAVLVTRKAAIVSDQIRPTREVAL